LGDDQSGHVKEVGFELYQSMLEEAVAALSNEVADDDHATKGQFAPNINLELAVLIPESYVQDLDLRLGLYRRLGQLDEADSVDQFGAELIDRFGPLPPEVDHLLRVVKLKLICRVAMVDRVDAGPKGVLIGFHEDRFPNPAGLLKFIDQSRGLLRLRPDHRMVVGKSWTSPLMRLQGLHQIIEELAEVAQQQEAA